MNDSFARLNSVPLNPGTSFVRTTDAPPAARLDDPAIGVMTDFRHVWPITIPEGVRIDDALAKMKSSGVRFLFVVDDANAIIGLITAADIMGEKPVKIVNEHRVQRGSIRVKDVMLRCADIRALPAAAVRNAEIGHIVTTLHAEDLSHMLVIEQAADGKGAEVVGLFSANDLTKRLGRTVRPSVKPAHSLAELVSGVA